MSWLGFRKNYKCRRCGWTDEQRSYCIKCNEREAEDRRREQANAHEQQMAEMRARHEKERREHEARMKELEAKHAKEAKEAKERRINSAIASCNVTMADLEKKIADGRRQRETLLKEQKEEEGKLEALQEILKKFAGRSKTERSNLWKKLDLNELKRKIDYCDDQISGAIKKTCVHESNIGHFLRLTQYLTVATMGNQTEIDKLSSIINVFGELISRQVNGSLSIENYFGDKMSRIALILKKEDMYEMEDIALEESNEKSDDYKELMEIITNGMQEEHEKWLEEKKEKEDNNEKYDKPEPKVKLQFQEKNFLKKACLKPDTWRKAQREKEDVLKKRLEKTSPVLGTFFDRMFKTMEQVQAILSYNNELDQTQLKAIENANKRMRADEQKALCDKPANKENEQKNENKNEDEKDEDIVRVGMENEENVKKDDKKEEEEQKKAESDEKELEMIVQGLDGSVKNKIQESMDLRNAAVVSIDVMESMNDMFSNCGTDGTTALGLATSVENSCIKIVRAQANVRQSIVLAQEICKLKPANVGEEAKKLWDAVDNGIIQIFETALALNKASMDYFGYFCKFQQSFNYFVSARDKSLMVSTEYLVNDAKQFKKFTETFYAQVEKLSTTAIECIKACVKDSIGAEAFEKVQKERQSACDNFLKAKSEYDALVAKLNADFDAKFAEKTAYDASIATKKLLIEALDTQIAYDEAMKNSTADVIKHLHEQKAQI